MQVPLSLYIHIPWCIKKCPYCDFNSHQADADELPEQSYLAALKADLYSELIACPSIATRTIQTVFIGGGTPSLLSAGFYRQLIQYLRQQLSFADNTEVTLEANPGTWEQANFPGFRRAGINRLSIGAQSFDNDQLIALGRIHNSESIYSTFNAARDAGFDNINIDLMHGLSRQSVHAALDDLRRAIMLQPEHLSWYKLTVEPNTVFYKHPPASLPDDEQQFEIAQAGWTLLAEHDYIQYEVSAFARRQRQARHNLNYWQFGDYIGIGAGAHGKLTVDGAIWRSQKTRMPSDYLASNQKVVNQKMIPEKELTVEFMLNALRLTRGFPLQLFEQRTGRAISEIAPILDSLSDKALIEKASWKRDDFLLPTEKGRLFVDDMVVSFIE